MKTKYDHIGIPTTESFAGETGRERFFEAAPLPVRAPAAARRVRLAPAGALAWDGAA